MKNQVDLLRIFAHSRAESDATAWNKILECLRDGVDIFSPFKTSDGLEQDAPIYFAFQVCNAATVTKLLKYATDMGQTIDLSYYMYDVGGRTITGAADEKLEWNALQHALIYGDQSTVKVLCDYASKHGQNPLEIIHQPIHIDDVVLTPQEIMVTAISLQTTNNLDTNAYTSPQVQQDLRKKIAEWMTGKNISIVNEFTAENPLQLTSNGRLEVFRYLVRNKYMNLRAITATGKPFHEWIERVSKRSNLVCTLVELNSKATVKEMHATKTEDEHIATGGLVTATGLLRNVHGENPIAIKVGVELRHLNEFVQDSILAEDAEIERQRELERLRAAAPKPEVRRHSFDAVKKDVAETKEVVANITEVRIKRYNNTKSPEEKTCFNMVYQTILAHMAARKLTSTELLDANPVTRNAKIGQALQTVFGIAMSAAPTGGQTVPAITRFILDLFTKDHAKKQSAAGFNAYLVSSVESMLLDLSEGVTAEIMEVYRNQRDTADFSSIAADVASLTIKRVDRELLHAEITNEEELFNFVLKEALVAVETQGSKNKADAFAIHNLQQKIREMDLQRGFSSSGSEASGSPFERKYYPSKDIDYLGDRDRKSKHKKGGDRCSIS